MGLVSRVVPAPARFDGRRACGGVRLCCDKGPLALRLAKEAVRRGCDLTFDQGVRLEQDLYVLLQTTRDRAEGVARVPRKAAAALPSHWRYIDR